MMSILPPYSLRPINHSEIDGNSGTVTVFPRLGFAVRLEDVLVVKWSWLWLPDPLE